MGDIDSLVAETQKTLGAVITKVGAAFTAAFAAFSIAWISSQYQGGPSQCARCHITYCGHYMHFCLVLIHVCCAGADYLLLHSGPPTPCAHVYAFLGIVIREQDTFTQGHKRARDVRRLRIGLDSD